MFIIMIIVAIFFFIIFYKYFFCIFIVVCYYLLFAYVNHVYVSYELSTKTDTVTHKPGAETDGWMDRQMDGHIDRQLPQRQIDGQTLY